MWSVLKSLLVKFALVRWLLGLFGSLGVLLPLAMLLLKFGWPLLLVLGVLGLPIMIFLFVLGLPVILVLVFGGLLIGAVAMLVPFALVALKIFLFVVLPIWAMWKVAGWVFGWGRGHRPTPPTPPVPPTPPAPPPPRPAEG